MFSSLSCSNCDYVFPPNTIPLPCPNCGSNSFKSDESSQGLSLHISTGRSYSLSHIQHAALFSRNSGSIEDEFGKDLSGLKFHNDNEAFVTAAIFSTVAFLECTMNEFFSDIADGSNTEFSKLYGDEIKEQINRLWNMDIPRTASYPILKKYQIALTLCKIELFNSGDSIYQMVDLLIKLRNYLIHAEPEKITLFTVGDIESHKALYPKLSEGLKGKFPTNKLLENTSSPFFPDKCLGHGCAEWGIKSSLKFTDEFFARIGIDPPYKSMENSLETMWEPSVVVVKTLSDS
jgi:hypothetical protein